MISTEKVTFICVPGVCILDILCISMVCIIKSSLRVSADEGLLSECTVRTIKQLDKVLTAYNNAYSK